MTIFSGIHFDRSRDQLFVQFIWCVKRTLQFIELVNISVEY
jgi:hypothetical protein